MSLSSVCDGLVEQALVVELDEDIAAVWKTMLGRHSAWLRSRIESFEMSAANVDVVLSARPRSVRDRAFATLLRNRISRGGILAAGAGRVNHGENGKGLSSRWYAETICHRIQEIEQNRRRIRFIHGDGLRTLDECAHDARNVYFIDPPYSSAGRRLYRHNEVDLRHLFVAAGHLKGDFLMTYETSYEIKALADAHGFQVRELSMRTAHHSLKTELLIGRDLSWLPHEQPSILQC